MRFGGATRINEERLRFVIARFTGELKSGRSQRSIVAPPSWQESPFLAVA